MLLFIQLSLQILHFGITFYKYNVGSGIKKNLGFRYWKCKCWTRRFSHGMHLFWITDPRMRHPKENEKSVSTLLGVSHHFREKESWCSKQKWSPSLPLMWWCPLCASESQAFFKREWFSLSLYFFDGALLLAVAGGGSMTRTIYSIFTRKKGFFWTIVIASNGIKKV